MQSRSFLHRQVLLSAMFELGNADRHEQMRQIVELAEPYNSTSGLRHEVSVYLDGLRHCGGNTISTCYDTGLSTHTSIN
jgi:hypothetical protein